ncbi:MAG: hypothetical protein WD960_02870 [Gemmatimonadota bacterium]
MLDGCAGERTRSGRTVPVALAFLPLLGIVGACDGDPSGPDNPGAEMVFDLDFRDPATGSRGWDAGFSDYPVEEEGSMELASGHEPLPAELDEEGHGLFIGATNRSDDVFMFWKGQVSGLEPEATYRVHFRVEFATNSPLGCAGVGGPPGESVWLKTGSTLVEPEPVPEEVGSTDWWRMNIDKGNQSQPGADVLLLGNVGIEESDCLDRSWGMKTLESQEPLSFSTDASGAAWLVVGTESGFESRTELYYTRVRAVFEVG